MAKKTIEDYRYAFRKLFVEMEKELGDASEVRVYSQQKY